MHDTNAVYSVALVRHRVTFAEEDVPKMGTAVIAAGLRVAFVAAETNVAPRVGVKASVVGVPTLVLKFALRTVQGVLTSATCEISLIREEGTILPLSKGFRAALSQYAIFFVRQASFPLLLCQLKGIRIHRKRCRGGLVVAHPKRPPAAAAGGPMTSLMLPWTGVHEWQGPGCNGSGCPAVVTLRRYRHGSRGCACPLRKDRGS